MKTLDFDRIKQIFKSNKIPYYFISPSNFNLINLHQWVHNWTNINYLNCFDDNERSCLVPHDEKKRAFASLEKINEFLLEHPSTIEKINSDIEEAGKGNAIFLFFNQKLQQICKELNLQLILPENDIVKSIDNKITTTEIGNEAQVFSVDNFLGKVKSYDSLVKICEEHNLGLDLVIQAPFGDSGKTTYFINSQEDYIQYASKIEAEDKVKVMRRISSVGSAIEACATSIGTFVGPLLSELVGFPELTPYKGGWCGNELYQEQFSSEVRKSIHEKTERLGNALYARGYKGYFEVDFLIDFKTQEIYLGEINPRITGISAQTNMAPFCQKTIPLFLFHLLEFSEIEIPIDPIQYNKFSLAEGHQGITSQMILKATHSGLRKVCAAPVSGVYALDEQKKLKLIKQSSNPQEKGTKPEHVFLLRIMNRDEYSYYGSDRIILFLNNKLTIDNGMKLNGTALAWINAVNEAFQTRELTEEEESLAKRFTNPTNTKGSEA